MITAKDLDNITYPKENKGHRMNFTYKGEELTLRINGYGNEELLMIWALQELNKKYGKA